nr:MAG: hypothetical protein 2 [Leviviridae sp.]
MFADPQSVTIGSAITLPRTGAGERSGAFTASDGNTRLLISHQEGRRTRRLMKLTYQKIAADPLSAGINVVASMSVNLTVDVPKTGFTVAEQKVVVDALVAYLTAGTGAKVTQLLGGES